MENANPNVAGCRPASGRQSRYGHVGGGAGGLSFSARHHQQHHQQLQPQQQQPHTSHMQRTSATAGQRRGGGALRDITNVPPREAPALCPEMPCSGGVAGTAPPTSSRPASARATAPALQSSAPTLQPPALQQPPALPPVPAAAPTIEGLPVEREGDLENVQAVVEYVPDIFDVLFQEEAAFTVRPNYMDQQKDINAKMRAILIDWLVEVHMKYQLRPETLFLTVNLIDRYLSQMSVVRKRLQLVGVAAMLIASKFEEIDPPKVNDFVYITDNAYTRDDILLMECTMLTTLGFNIVVPTPAHFLDRLQGANQCDSLHREVSQYLLELALLDLSMARHSPSHLVSAALLLSNELLGRRPAWPAAMAQHTRHSERALRECAENLWELVEAAPASSLQAVRKKYMLQQHQSVAMMTFTASLSARC